MSFSSKENILTIAQWALVGQGQLGMTGGEFRHIGRRFSPWTTEILIEQGGVMPDVTKGIARTAPLNAWNDGKTAVLRQSPQPPEQARGV